MPDEDDGQVEEQRNEIDVLAPELSTIKLSSGTEVEIVPLKMRQLFGLMRIITHGAGQSISFLQWQSNPEEFAGQMLAIIAFAIPEAEDETMEFLARMTKPVRDPVDSDLAYDEKVKALKEELDDPEIDDAATVIEAIIRRDAKDFQALGKRLRSAMEMFRKTGQDVPPVEQATPEKKPRGKQSSEKPEKQPQTEPPSLEDLPVQDENLPADLVAS